MRMWNVNPRYMCRKHLLGEHVETHMLVGTLRKEKSVQGYIIDGLIDLDTVVRRHGAVAAEMLRRGYNHKSPMTDDDINVVNNHNIHEFLGCINEVESIRELRSRCTECHERMKDVDIAALVVW